MYRLEETPMARQVRNVWLWLVAVGLVGIVSAQSARPTFEVASVKRQTQQATVAPPPMPPNVFYRRNATAAQLIRFAFDLYAVQVVGGPDWVGKDGFEIHAKAAGPASAQDMRLMVQSLLEDRFKLVVHEEHRDVLSGRLVLASPDGTLGPNLKKCDPEDPPPPLAAQIPRSVDNFLQRCGPISAVASFVSTVVGFPVIDETHLSGAWTVELRYERSQPLTVSAQQNTSTLTAPPIRDALKAQLGLEVESRRGPVPVIVIDSIDQPDAN
jgi:uncharacterized protein (TIGR03435 family)